MSNLSKSISDTQHNGVFCVPAILRCTVKTTGPEVGTIIALTRVGVEKRGAQLVMCWSDFTGTCEWIWAHDFLLMTEYLKRQPVDHFWALILKASMDSAPSYLCNTETKKYGPMPFRFESVGELTYYMKTNQLNNEEHGQAEFSLWT